MAGGVDDVVQGPLWGCLAPDGSLVPGSVAESATESIGRLVDGEWVTRWIERRIAGWRCVPLTFVEGPNGSGDPAVEALRAHAARLGASGDPSGVAAHTLLIDRLARVDMEIGEAAERRRKRSRPATMGREETVPLDDDARGTFQLFSGYIVRIAEQPGERVPEARVYDHPDGAEDRHVLTISARAAIKIINDWRAAQT